MGKNTLIEGCQPWCPESGLLQLKHSCEVYGNHSGLNRDMARYLTRKIRELERLWGLHSGDAILDIGSNDATSPKVSTTAGLRIGCDSTGTKFLAWYGDCVGISRTASLGRDADFLSDGDGTIFPFPEIEIVRERAG
jgi:hypothetical protein